MLSGDQRGGTGDRTGQLERRLLGGQQVGAEEVFLEPADARVGKAEDFHHAARRRIAVSAGALLADDEGEHFGQVGRHVQHRNVGDREKYRSVRHPARIEEIPRAGWDDAELLAHKALGVAVANRFEQGRFPLDRIKSSHGAII